MLIDRINSKVKTFLNTDGRGNYSPEDFNMFLHDAIQARNEEYFFEIGRLVNRENKGLASNLLENLPDRLREKVAHYLVPEASISLTSGKTDTYDLPADCRYLDDVVLSADGTSFEFCGNSREFNIVKGVATPQYPIYMKVGNTIRVYPETASGVSLNYLRTIRIPKWTYDPVTELFNPDANDFQDADIHPSEENEMVIRVLKSFGVNLKETDIQSFTLTEEGNEFNRESAT